MNITAHKDALNALNELGDNCVLGNRRIDQLEKIIQQEIEEILEENERLQAEYKELLEMSVNQAMTIKKYQNALEIIATDFIHGEKGRGISAKGILELATQALEQENR